MNQSKFIFAGVIIKENKRYTGICLELDVATEGETVEETKTNLLEAVTVYLETAIESNLPVLRPIPAEEDPVNVAPDNVVEKFPLKVDVKIHTYA